MPVTASKPNNAESARRYRERLAAQGLRQIHIWVPDTRSALFAEECRRQSSLLTEDVAERALMGELEAGQDDTGWHA